jgi:hypothetical protein
MGPIEDELKLSRRKKHYQQYQDSLDQKKSESTGQMHGKKIQKISSVDSPLPKHLKPS